MKALRALGVLGAAGLMLTAAVATPGYHESGEPEFDYYVLSLSWSPAFCRLHPDDQQECGLRRGFIVHGLWPQYKGGGGPEHCGGTDQLDAETIQRVKSAMPDERLIRHEWIVHGTCTGLSAHDYFLTMIHAVGRLSIPSEFDGQSRHSLTVSQIVSTFVKANPSLAPESLALRCHGPRFEEARICLSRDLNPQACGPDVRTHCREGPVEIDPAR